MGRMKEFGLWLGVCVHQHNMTNEQIISAFKKSLAEDDSQDDTDHWLCEQIETVRNNPMFYETLVK